MPTNLSAAYILQNHY